MLKFWDNLPFGTNRKLVIFSCPSSKAPYGISPGEFLENLSGINPKEKSRNLEWRMSGFIKNISCDLKIKQQLTLYLKIYFRAKLMSRT